MAYDNDTVAGNVALWDYIIDFLTTGLGADNWDVAWTAPGGEEDGIVLKAAGSTGTEEIFIGFSRVDSVDTDANHINIYGMTGVLEDATNMSGHINVSPEVRIWADASTMKVWIVANARRMIIVVNISTVYQAAYAGFYLPYAPPTSYPYPMFIGGTSNIDTDVADWRSTSPYHSQFPFAPRIGGSGSDGAFRANSWLLDNAGAWVPVMAGDDTAIAILPNYAFDEEIDGNNNWHITPEWTSSSSYRKMGYNGIRSRITQNFGGGFALEQMTFARVNPATEMIGVLDGAYFVPGVGNVAENTIEIDSIDYLVVQDVFRTVTTSYWAMKLE